MTPKDQAENINRILDNISRNLSDLIYIEREIRQKLFNSGKDDLEKKSRRRLGKLIRMRSAIHECVVNHYEIP